MVPGEVMAADLVNGQALMTVHSSELTVQVTGDQVTLVDAAGNSANVITGDVAASNGVIHIIDAVLLPHRVAGRPRDRGHAHPGRPGRSA